ncbi:hypothetical protein JKG47_01985 [Acidithiobacillus sp. MC6.1]|nr:hypothetical protein [Acidithiobacillus sp. MC6.1]
MAIIPTRGTKGKKLLKKVAPPVLHDPEGRPLDFLMAFTHVQESFVAYMDSGEEDELPDLVIDACNQLADSLVHSLRMRGNSGDARLAEIVSSGVRKFGEQISTLKEQANESLARSEEMVEEVGDMVEDEEADSPMAIQTTVQALEVMYLATALERATVAIQRFLCGVYRKAFPETQKHRVMALNEIIKTLDMQLRQTCEDALAPMLAFADLVSEHEAGFTDLLDTFPEDL